MSQPIKTAGTSLVPLVISSCVGAAGLAYAEPSTVMVIVGKILSGLSVNYASEHIPKIGSSVAMMARHPARDLERVAKHTLLVLLYETLIEGEWEQAEAEAVVRDVAESWDLSLSVDLALPPDELLAVVRNARPLDLEQSRALARELLRHGHAVAWDTYAAAINTRFVETYSELVRSDDRAYRAAILYLQQQQLGELGQILRAVSDAAEQTTSALRALPGVLARLSAPQPTLERYEHLRKHSGESLRPTDFQFKRCATHYFPRQQCIAAIHDFLLGPQPLRILKILGAAGMGKSRLALELCDTLHADGWLAGFVPRGGGHWPADWEPLRDTIVVVDYAGAKTVGGQPLFDWLRQLHARASASRPRVRVVLVDRTDQGEAWTQWRKDEIAADLDDLTHTITLTPLRTEFLAIVSAEFSRRTGEPPPQSVQRTIAAVADRLHGQYRPLFAQLLAAALADAQSGSSPQWSPELLVEALLKNQVHQWELAGVTNADLDLVFEATLTQTLLPDPDAARSVSVHASLSSLADEAIETGIAPIAPDLLGEFFVLMRLSDRASIGSPRAGSVASASQAIVDRVWQNDTASAMFCSLLMQDFLAWRPKDGVNATLSLSESALALARSGNQTQGVTQCCFVTVWKEPARDWEAWLTTVPATSRPHFASVVGTALYNASLDVQDAAARKALIDRMSNLADAYPKVWDVRERLAAALAWAIEQENGPTKDHWAITRLVALTQTHGLELPLVQALARAVQQVASSATTVEVRQSTIDLLRTLHVDTVDPIVRDHYARALANSLDETGTPDDYWRLVAELFALYNAHGGERAVRHSVAKALWRTADIDKKGGARAVADLEALYAIDRQDPVIAAWLAGGMFFAFDHATDRQEIHGWVERLTTLHEHHSDVSLVRERLAAALANAGLMLALDAPGRETALNRLTTLHEGFGEEAGVRHHLSTALANAPVMEASSPERMWPLIERLDTLYSRYPNDEVVRERFAQALANVVGIHPDANTKRLALDRLLSLRDAHPVDAHVRDAMARALANAVGHEDEALHTRHSYLDRLSQLAETHEDDATVRAWFARALRVMVGEEPDATLHPALVARLGTLHALHGREAAVRQDLARALTALANSPDSEIAVRAIDDLERLHRDHGEEPAVRENLAIALASRVRVENTEAPRLETAERLVQLHQRYADEPTLRRLLAVALTDVVSALARTAGTPACLPVVEQISTLHEVYGHEPDVRGPLATSLYYAVLGATDGETATPLVARLEQLHSTFGYEANVRDRLTRALLALSATETDPAVRLEVANRLADIYDAFPDDPDTWSRLADAFTNSSNNDAGPPVILGIINRLLRLHEEHGAAPPIRELLGAALLYFATIVDDPAASWRVAEMLSALHASYGHESAIRAMLATALCHGTMGQTDPDIIEAALEQLTTLYLDHGREAEVGEQLENALSNLAAGEADPTRKRELEGRQALFRRMNTPEQTPATGETIVSRGRASGLADGDVPGELTDDTQRRYAGADPKAAAQANLTYQNALAEWRSLPWWRRLTTVRPEPPVGI